MTVSKLGRRTKLVEKCNHLTPSSVTTEDARRAQQFKPLRVDHYFDRLRIWCKEVVDDSLVSRLEGTCEAVHTEATPAYFDPHYKHKLEIYQPRRSAFCILEELPDDAIVTYVEVACDVICPDDSSLKRLARVFLSGFLQSHHRGKQPYVYAAEDYPHELTGFTTRKNPEKGARRRGVWFQWYIDKHSRMTGELHCFHFEGKHEGRRAVKRISISHPRDLGEFVFNRYFNNYVSTLYEIDFERLGRWLSNRRTGGKRKKPYIDAQGNNRDFRMGHLVYRVRALHPESTHWPFNSLQHFVDHIGRGPYLRPYSIMFMGTNTLTS